MTTPDLSNCLGTAEWDPRVPIYRLRAPGAQTISAHGRIVAVRAGAAYRYPPASDEPSPDGALQAAQAVWPTATWAEPLGEGRFAIYGPTPRG